MNKINNIKSQLIKVEWANLSPNESAKKFKNFSIKHDLLGEIKLSIKKTSPTDIKIELKNKENNILGKEDLTIDTPNKYMFGQNIEVNSLYRRKGLGLGELLRACSIMFMKENNINILEIFSKSTAVFFHKKFKFKPSENSLVFNKRMLNSIINDSNKNIEPIKNKAKEINQKIINIQEFTDREQKLCDDTNNLTNEFLENALHESKNPEIKHTFLSGFSMSLTKDEVEKNKEFYNAIYKKYNIDYKI